MALLLFGVKNTPNLKNVSTTVLIGVTIEKRSSLFRLGVGGFYKLFLWVFLPHPTPSAFTRKTSSLFLNARAFERSPSLSAEVFDTTFFDTDTILILCRSEYSIPIQYWYFSVIKFRYRYWYWYYSALSFDTDIDTDTSIKCTDTKSDTKIWWNCHFSAQKSTEFILFIAFQGPWRYKDSTDTKLETCFRERWYWYWYWYFNIWNFDTDTDTDTFQV